MRSVALAAVLLCLATAGSRAEVFGDKKSGIKGRYLEVEQGLSLRDYRGAIVVLEPAEIVSDKDKPVDTEAVRATSDEVLREKLETVSSIKDVVAEVPLELTEGTPLVKMRTKLTLQHGSQAMRVFAGGGAGKSKLHISVELLDAKSGKRIATFNGYGSGAGMWSISGGGVQRMARDDLQESYEAFATHLSQAGM